MIRAIVVLASALAIDPALTSAADVPDAGCGFSGMISSLNQAVDGKSYWKKQADKYAKFLAESKWNVRILLIENEKLRASSSYEMRQAVASARANGEDPKEAAVLAHMGVLDEIQVNMDSIRDERAQQKLYQSCIDYSERKFAE